MNYNKSVIVGRVATTPELRKTQSGQSVISFSIATNRIWTDSAGAKQESAEFHNIVAWGKLAELASAYLTKGSLALVEGRLETRSWDDKDGIMRRTTEIIADNIQFGPKPQIPNKNRDDHPHPVEDVPTIHLDADEDDTGRTLKPLFSGEVEKEEQYDHPF